MDKPETKERTARQGLPASWRRGFGPTQLRGVLPGRMSLTTVKSGRAWLPREERVGRLSRQYRKRCRAFCAGQAQSTVIAGSGKMDEKGSGCSAVYGIPQDRVRFAEQLG